MPPDTMGAGGESSPRSLRRLDDCASRALYNGRIRARGDCIGTSIEIVAIEPACYGPGVGVRNARRQ